MSLQTLFEGDTNKGEIFLRDIQVDQLNALELVGAGQIFNDVNSTPPAAAAATQTVLVTLSNILLENEVYLVLWQCGVNSVAGNDLVTTSVQYDIAGQNAFIGSSADFGTAAAPGFKLLSGFNLLTVTSAGAGAGKQVRFLISQSATGVQVEAPQVSFIKITSVFV